MGIKVRCPLGHAFNAEEENRGRFARCPKCSRVALVPAAASGAAEAESPVSRLGGLAARFNAAKTPETPAKSQISPSKPLLGKPTVGNPAVGKPPMSQPSASKTSPPPKPMPPTQQRSEPATPPALPKPKATPTPPERSPKEPVVTAPKPAAPAPPTASRPSAAPNASVESRRSVAPGSARDKSSDGGKTKGGKSGGVSPLRPTRWVGYQAEGSWKGKVYVLAIQSILLALLQLVPATPFLDLRSAPDWARIAVLLAALQIAYACWMWLVPDWSTVWVAMLVLAAVAALYGTALGIAWVTPPGSPAPLGLPPARLQQQLWCGAIIAVTLALTYACGRVSYRWHKAYGKA